MAISSSILFSSLEAPIRYACSTLQQHVQPATERLKNLFFRIIGKLPPPRADALAPKASCPYLRRFAIMDAEEVKKLYPEDYQIKENAVDDWQKEHQKAATFSDPGFIVEILKHPLGGDLLMHPGTKVRIEKLRSFLKQEIADISDEDILRSCLPGCKAEDLQRLRMPVMRSFSIERAAQAHQFFTEIARLVFDKKLVSKQDLLVYCVSCIIGILFEINPGHQKRSNFLAMIAGNDIYKLAEFACLQETMDASENSVFISGMRVAGLSRREISIALICIIGAGISNAPQILEILYDQVTAGSFNHFQAHVQAAQKHNEIPPCIIHAVNEAIFVQTKNGHDNSIERMFTRATAIVEQDPQGHFKGVCLVFREKSPFLLKTQSLLERQNAQYSLEEVSNAPISRFPHLDYLPFGRGPNSCPAQWMARQLMYSALMHAVLKYSSDLG